MNHLDKISQKTWIYPCSGHRRRARRVVLNQLHHDHRQEPEYDEGHLQKQHEILFRIISIFPFFFLQLWMQQKWHKIHF